jgi:hypothetical protein
MDRIYGIEILELIRKELLLEADAIKNVAEHLILSR